MAGWHPPGGRGFWTYVDKTGECWVWTAYRDPKGYGRAWGGYCGGPSRTILAHRISWQLTHGAIPEGACILHRCDNPPCVRPDHLFLGTKADNTADMIGKGRAEFNRNRSWGSRTHGTRNAHAKLTEDQVIEMRRRAAAGEHYTTLGAAYGISASRANAIINRAAWRHI